MKKEALRLSTMVPTAPTTLYYAWLNAEQHSAMTGGPAKIDPEVGGKFTAWNGYVTGKLVILDLGRRLVMSWRTGDFPREAPDSRVEVHFEALGGSTRVTVLHTEIPEGQSEKCREVWNDKYFTPMRSFFSKYLPDPRLPPPPRRPIPPEDDEEDEGEEEIAPPKKGKLGARPEPAAKAPARVAAPSRPAKTVKAAPAKPAKPAAKAASKPATKPKAKANGAKNGGAKNGGATKPAAKKAAAKPATKKPAAKPKAATKAKAKGKKR